MKIGLEGGGGASLADLTVRGAEVSVLPASLEASAVYVPKNTFCDFSFQM